jgi:uncharacterized protein YpmS
MAKSKNKLNGVYIYIALAVLIGLVLIMIKLSSRASDTSMYQTPTDASVTSGDIDTDIQTLDQLMNESNVNDFNEIDLSE